MGAKHIADGEHEVSRLSIKTRTERRNWTELNWTDMVIFWRTGQRSSSKRERNFIFHNQKTQ